MTAVQSFPGSEATPADLLRLADAYHAVADDLLSSDSKGPPGSRAPGRFCALHAIELYLGAYLRNAGSSAVEVRGFRHDLAAMSAKARRCGLALRVRTAGHLDQSARDREYLVARYAPERDFASQQNRLTATLDELARKVRTAMTVDRPAAPGATAPAAAASTPRPPAEARPG